MIRFWQRFFDQNKVGLCPENEYMTLLEEIVRGVSLSKPSKTTELFAVMYQRKLEESGCLLEDKTLCMVKYKEAIEQGKIDT